MNMAVWKIRMNLNSLIFLKTLTYKQDLVKYGARSTFDFTTLSIFRWLREAQNINKTEQRAWLNSNYSNASITFIS